MRFAVGYQLTDPDDGRESFADMVSDYLPHVAEVYFPWADLPSGRAALTARRGYVDWSAQQRMERELVALRRMGVGLDLLFNAACYGAFSAARYLENQVASVIEHLEDLVGGPDTVTTASLAVARTVKRHFPKVRVRASVNMRIGTVRGMRYVAGLFDAYHVQRDHNRDLQRLGGLKRWADDNSKGLSMLANSGCLAFCSGQSYHDNLVAHEREIDEVDTIADWNPMVCWNLLRDRANWQEILQATWVRPEDLHHYDGLFETVKLATRMHHSPRLVLDAYVRRGHHGNLLDLFEPGFAPALAPWVIDNDRFPEDWFARCAECEDPQQLDAYCGQVLQSVLRQAEPAP